MVEQVVRRDSESRYLFLVNRGNAPLPLPGLTGEVLVGPSVGDGFILPPGEVAVLRQRTPQAPVPPGDRTV